MEQQLKKMKEYINTIEKDLIVAHEDNKKLRTLATLSTTSNGHFPSSFISNFSNNAPSPNSTFTPSNYASVPKP